MLIELLPNIEFPILSCLNLIKEEEPTSRFLDDPVQEREVFPREGGQANILKIEIKPGLSKALHKLQ